MAKLLLVVVCVCVATAAGDLRSLSPEKILDMLRSWNLDDKFGSVFEDKGYDGYALDVMTKEDLDAEFSDVSPLNRRALYERIQGIKNSHGVSRRLKEVDFKGYTGVEIPLDKSYIAFGKNKEIKIYRDGKGTLKIVAPAIDLVSEKLIGLPLAPPSGPPCILPTMMLTNYVNGMMFPSMTMNGPPPRMSMSGKGYSFRIRFTQPHPAKANTCLAVINKDYAYGVTYSFCHSNVVKNTNHKRPGSNFPLVYINGQDKTALCKQGFNACMPDRNVWYSVWLSADVLWNSGYYIMFGCMQNAGGEIKGAEWADIGFWKTKFPTSDIVAWSKMEKSTQDPSWKSRLITSYDMKTDDDTAGLALFKPLSSYKGPKRVKITGMEDVVSACPKPAATPICKDDTASSGNKDYLMVDNFAPKCAKPLNKRTEHKSDKEFFKAAWTACNALKDCEVIKYHTNGMQKGHTFWYELFGSCKFEGSCVDKNSCSNTIQKCVPDQGKHSSYRVYVKKTSLQANGKQKGPPKAVEYLNKFGGKRTGRLFEGNSWVTAGDYKFRKGKGTDADPFIYQAYIHGHDFIKLGAPGQDSTIKWSPSGGWQDNVKGTIPDTVKVDGKTVTLIHAAHYGVFYKFQDPYS